MVTKVGLSTQVGFHILYLLPFNHRRSGKGQVPSAILPLPENGIGPQQEDELQKYSIRAVFTKHLYDDDEFPCVHACGRPDAALRISLFPPSV